MKIYAKLINNQLEYPGNTLILNSRECTKMVFATAEYLENGYKELVQTPQPTIKWFEQCVVSYGENDIQIVEQWEVKPLDNLKDIYKTKSNNKCDMTIAFGFTFIDNQGITHQVRATETDQWNYFNSKEPFPCEIKVWEDDYYVFQTQIELDRFRTELEKHIIYTLKIVCWGEKRAIIGMTNQEIYEYLQVSDPFGS